jgi:hypothetical protein
MQQHTEGGHVRMRAGTTRVVGAVLASSCLLLAACTSSAATVTPTPTRTAATLNGCPAQQPPARATTPAIVEKGGGVNATPISMRIGQTLEIQLSDTLHWSLRTSELAPVLVGTPGNGWHDAARHACVWQFGPSAAGQETLSFTGTAICTAGVACPQFALLVQYTVVVSD